MTAAMILCAGLGTRLRPLTEWCAKPLVPVGDRPALAHIVARMRGLGGVVAVNAHHRAADVRAFAEREGVLVSEEPELLGTAGGVERARALLGDGDVLVWNGDILIDLDAPALARAHAAAGAAATLAVVPRPRGEGNVGVNEAGHVVRLRREATAPGETRGGDFVGVHMLGLELRRALPARGCLVGDVYLPALRKGAHLAVLDAPRLFHDLGSPADYLEANLAWLRARGEGAWRAEGTCVADAVSVVESVLGAGARVTGAGVVERCVVWPGAEARAPLANAIVAREGTVRL